MSRERGHPTPGQAADTAGDAANETRGIPRRPRREEATPRGRAAVGDAEAGAARRPSPGVHGDAGAHGVGKLLWATRGSRTNPAELWEDPARWALQTRRQSHHPGGSAHRHSSCTRSWRVMCEACGFSAKGQSSPHLSRRLTFCIYDNMPFEGQNHVFPDPPGPPPPA